MRRTHLALGRLAALALLTACGGSDGSPAAPPPPVAVASLAVSGLPAAMMAGDVAQLAAVAKDAQGNALSGRVVSWSSSDTLVAAVGATGQVTAVGHGPVTISATAEGRSASAQGQVTLTSREKRFAYTFVPGTAPASGAAGTNTENATGGDVRISHPSMGDFVVTFGRMARADTAWRESVMITALTGGSARCNINNWTAAANRRDLDVSVSCYTTDASKINGSFYILAVGNGALEGRHGFVESADSAQTHTPPASRNFNTSGQMMTVNHLASGAYRVDVNNPRGAGMVENYFVSTLGDPGATCILAGWSLGNYSNIDCTTANATREDRRFTMQLIEAGRAGKRWAYAWASIPVSAVGSEYIPSTSYQRMSNGQQVGITRVDNNGYTTGFYDVRFPGLGGLFGQKHNIQVSAYSSGRVSCAGFDQGTANGGADLVVRVTCIDRYAGTPLSTYYTVLVIE